MGGYGMRLKLVSAIIVWASFCVFNLHAVFADEEGGNFHFDVGISFVDGIYKANSALSNEVNNFEGSPFEEGFQSSSYSSVVVPIGVQLDPYYLFNFGLGIGGAIGPDQVLDFSDGLGDEDISAVIPVGLDLRYELLNNSGFVPYARLGFRYPIAVGDNYSHGQVGVFGAVGIEFTRIHLGLEASYDSSTIEVSYQGLEQRVTPSGFMATLYFHF
jgi:hypothetical protein